MSHQRTVYLIDDDPADRHRLAFELGNFGIEAWPFAGGVELLGALPHLRPECIILSMGVPHQSGLQLMGELLRRGSDWPVIAVSRAPELRTAVEAMKLGAIEFLAKPIDIEALLSALGEASLALENSVLANEKRRSAEERVACLTPRERDISSALVRGQANKMTAHQLGISVRTVEAHRANIMMKLGVRSLAELVLLVTEARIGFMSPGPRPPHPLPRRPVPGGGTVAPFPTAPMASRRPSSGAAV